MEMLKERIRKDGVVKGTDVLKVDSFLNHQMDITLFGEIGKEFQRRFADSGVNKILTIEASGIGIACITAQYFNCPVIFAKKTQTKNIAGEVYTTKVESFTHGRIYDVIVSKRFLGPGDRVLVIDDGKVAMFEKTDKVFAQSARLSQMGLRVPQITKIMTMLREKGYPVSSGVLTVEQGVQEILRILGREEESRGQ